MAIIPGSSIGMLGGGQLGRMFVTAARRMGYEVLVLDPDPASPAGSMASRHLVARYDDIAALDVLARECAVITTEFENIPADTLHYLARSTPVHPSAEALAIAQNRIREKTFVQSLGLKTSPFIALRSEGDLDQVRHCRFPAILKTSTLGYDGKGQAVCDNEQAVREAYARFGVECILEEFIQLDKEISVVLSRSARGETFCFPVAENSHANGILDVSVAPAAISEALATEAREAAMAIAQGLDYRGVMAVEFFVSRAGELLVNEMAPRPHNSGHFTLDACYVSQFEQQVRMICGLESGNCALHTPVAMLNVLGDIWPDEGCPDWFAVLADPAAHLHLYGKKQARAGRKMGHINFLASDTAAACESLNACRRLLGA